MTHPNLNRRRLSTYALLAGTAAGVGVPVRAFSPLPPPAPPAPPPPSPSDAEYKLLKQPQPTQVAGKIEVIEFFRYGCPACNAFEPAITAWKKTLPPQVNFIPVAVAFPEPLLAHTRMFYTLQTMGREDALHGKIFNAIHGQRKTLNTDVECADFLATLGIDRNTYLQTVTSFSVQSRVKRAEKMGQSYQLEGVPAVIVQGKYMTSPALAQGYEAALQVADYLIAVETAKLPRPAGKTPAVAASAVGKKAKPKTPTADQSK